MDFAQTTERVKAILTNPRAEWPVIGAEPASVGSLYTGYIMPVAALPAIAGFIKGSLIGYNLLGITVRDPVATGLGRMLLTYVLSLLVVYLLALAIDALAPTFGGQKGRVQALKAIAYAWTAAWIAGIAVIVPWLGALIAVAGVIYAIYLLYLGLPQTMQCPREKAGVYTAVSVVIAMVLGWAMSLLVAGTIGTTALGVTTLGNTGLINRSGDSVTLDRSPAGNTRATLDQRGAGTPGRRPTAGT
jgi:hypothetical protein